LALGGLNDPTNLVTACAECNAGKSSGVAGADLVADVKGDQSKWLEAIRIAAELHVRGRPERRDELDRFEMDWNEWHPVLASGKKSKKTVYLPNNARDTVGRFLELGLPIEEVLRLIRVAMQAKMHGYQEDARFRYFVGCCKNVLAAIQSQAQEIIDNQPTGDSDSVRPN